MMKCFTLLAVLGACVISAQAYTKCVKKTLDEIKANVKGTPLDLKLNLIKPYEAGIIAYVTNFYFPDLGVKCATTTLEKDAKKGDSYSVTTYNSFNKAKPELVKAKLEKDDLGYYTKDSEGRKIYNIPFFAEDGVVAYYTCADKDSKKILDDPVKDAAIKVLTPVLLKTGKEIKAAVAKAKSALNKAEETGKKYGFSWNPAYGGPEKCEEAVNGPKI